VWWGNGMGEMERAHSELQRWGHSRQRPRVGILRDTLVTLSVGREALDLTRHGTLVCP
jgi:hypothetical protein